MWETGQEQVPIAADESCFRIDEALIIEDEEEVELRRAITRAQAQLKDLRAKEEEQDQKIRELKSELHRAREKSGITQATTDVDIGFLIDSEDNYQWFKKRAPELVESLNALKVDGQTVRVGAVYYNSQKSLTSDSRVLPFTDDFSRLLQDIPVIRSGASNASALGNNATAAGGGGTSTGDVPPAAASPLLFGSPQKVGLKGALGEALSLLQWQGSARLLLHPSPSSAIQKGQDPPTSQYSNFFTRFGTSSEDTNMELQRAVLALRAMCVEYFIVKTDTSVRQKRGEAKLSVAILNLFDDADSFLECKTMKVEETHNIKKAILSCISMAMRS